MSPNLDLVRSIFASERGDYSWAHPDIEVDLTAVYPDQPILHGIADMRRFSDLAWGTSQRLQPERFFDIDDERVLVFVRGTATGQSSGAPVEVRTAHKLTIRDGRIVRIKVYLDRAEALAAVGLAPEAGSP